MWPPCVVCGKAGAWPPEGRLPKIELCPNHYVEVFQSPELVDDLAREIYVKEWLIPQKLKKK